MLAPSPARAMQGFAASLRLNGFAIGKEQTAQALKALALLGVAAPAPKARALLRCVFASSYDEWSRFDELFEAHWFGRGRQRLGAAAAAPSVATQKVWRAHLPQIAQNAAAGALAENAESAEGDNDNSAQAQPAGLRLQAANRQARGGAPVAAANRQMLMALGERLALALRQRKSRRWRPARRGPRPDLRALMRRSMERGGEPLVVPRRRRKMVAARLTALLDVSASMRDSHAMLFYVVLGMQRAGGEVFVFHTRLARVSGALADSNPVRAMQKFALQMGGWDGGTRIAESVDRFCRQYGASRLGGRGVVAVFSDGYDSAPPQALARAVARLRARAPRLFWFSPVLGSPFPALEDLPRALAAALPGISQLAAAKTPAQLEAFAANWRP